MARAPPPPTRGDAHAGIPALRHGIRRGAPRGQAARRLHGVRQQRPGHGLPRGGGGRPARRAAGGICSALRASSRVAWGSGLLLPAMSSRSQCAPPPRAPGQPTRPCLAEALPEDTAAGSASTRASHVGGAIGSHAARSGGAAIDDCGYVQALASTKRRACTTQRRRGGPGAAPRGRGPTRAARPSGPARRRPSPWTRASPPSRATASRCIGVTALGPAAGRPGRSSGCSARPGSHTIRGRSPLENIGPPGSGQRHEPQSDGLGRASERASDSLHSGHLGPGRPCTACPANPPRSRGAGATRAQGDPERGGRSD